MSGPDLVAAVLELEPRSESRIPRSHGVLVHAAAVSLLDRLRPGLGELLHDVRARHRPFVAGPLTPPAGRGRDPSEPRAVGRWLVLTPGTLYRWRLTALSGEVARALLGLSGDEVVHLATGALQVRGVHLRAEQDPEAGQDSYAEIWGRCEGIRLLSVTLSFVSPTTFRGEGREQPFPAPRLVFGSLLRRWTAFSGIPLPGLDADTLDRVLHLANWYGQTRRVEFVSPAHESGVRGRGAHGATGFVGRFTYRVEDASRELHRALAALSHFAFYSGVGWLTTHGLGQVRTELQVAAPDEEPAAAPKHGTGYAGPPLGT